MGRFSTYLTLPDYLDAECSALIDMTMRYEVDFRHNHHLLMSTRERIVFAFNQEADHMVRAERIEGLLTKMRAKVINEDQCGALWSAEVPTVAVDRHDQRRAGRRGMFAHEVMRDTHGTRWEKQPNFLVVEVINSTAEPDGTFNHYFLPVHPELRPIPDPITQGNAPVDSPINPYMEIRMDDMRAMRTAVSRSMAYQIGGPYRPDPNEGYGHPQELTARNAVASTFGLIGSEYHPTIET